MARLYDAFDWMMPGQFEAFAERKAFCERQVRQGIAAGAPQVLRAWRRLRHPGVAIGARVPSVCLP